MSDTPGEGAQGDDGSASGPDGTGAGDDATVGTGDGNNGDDGATPGDAASGGDATDAGPSDGDAGTGLPTITCMIEDAGGAFQRCSAAFSTGIVGGSVPNGEYWLTRWHDSTQCTQTPFVIGRATVLDDGNGHQLMRFERTFWEGGTAVPALPATSGTEWLQLNPVTGAVTRTELCDPGHVGNASAGTYAFVADAAFVQYDGVYFFFNDHQEQWGYPP